MLLNQVDVNRELTNGYGKNGDQFLWNNREKHLIFQERICREWRHGMCWRWALLREEVKACLYADHIGPGSGEKIPDVGEKGKSLGRCI